MKKDALREEQRLAFLMIVWRIPKFITSLVAAVASGSMVVWLEFMENVSILVPGILFAVLSRKMGKNLKYQFNYGTGKLEAITAFACEMFDIAGLLCILSFSARKLFRPGEEEGNFLLALGVSVVGLGIDVFLLRRQKRLAEQGRSKMLHTAYLSAQKEFAFDLITIFTLIVAAMFRHTAWIRYFSPVLCILVAVPFGAIVLRHFGGTLSELTDQTLDEESQMKLLKVLSEFTDSYEDWWEIRSRVSGEHKQIDVEISFPPQMPYSEVTRVVALMRRRVSEEIEESVVNFVISEGEE